MSENVGRAARDQSFEDVLDAAERRMVEVDLSVVPGLEPEGARTLVRAAAQKRADREHVPTSRLPPRDPLELAELLERIDAHVRVGADADSDPARTDALDGQEAVAEVRLRRRARADPRAGAGEEVELV